MTDQEKLTYSAITISAYLDSDGDPAIRCDFNDMAVVEVLGLLEWAKFAAIREATRKWGDA